MRSSSDFGGLPGLPGDVDRKRVSDQLLRRFLEVVHKERRRLSLGVPCRRIIGLNTINNQFELLVGSFIAAAATPCATHMRHGFVLPAKSKDDWLPLLHIGQAGVRVGHHVNSDPRKLGVIAYGPYKYLDAGFIAYPSGSSWRLTNLNTAETRHVLSLKFTPGQRFSAFICLVAQRWRSLIMNSFLWCLEQLLM